MFRFFFNMTTVFVLDCANIARYRFLVFQRSLNELAIVLREGQA
jgi:hypothetical protein